VQNFTLGDAYTITANVVNSAHISVLRRVNNRGYAANDINAATLGVNVFQQVKNGLQLSEGKFTIGGGTNSVAHFNDNTAALDDDVTWVHGKHQIGFGGEWVQNQLNIGNAYESNGIFTFNGEYSGSGPAGGSVIGDPKPRLPERDTGQFVAISSRASSSKMPCAVQSESLRSGHLPRQSPNSPWLLDCATDRT